MRILLTGGSGKAGAHVAAHLAAEGHKVTNLDLVPLGAEGVEDLRADITQGGQVWGALRMYAGFDELEPGTGVPSYDAVVHLAAVPRIGLTPDGECYRVNTVGTYNILEAATGLGIPKIVIASSETVYGVCFADGERLPEYLPLDEDHPTVPEDSYAMSKVANEAAARSFQRRSGADIYALRINNVVEPGDYARDFPAYLADPSLRRRNFFAYIDARDLGGFVSRCLAVDGLGYQVFNVANEDHSVKENTQELIERFYPEVPVRREMGPAESFYDTTRARRLLDWRPRHSWRGALGRMT
ncbi:NAD-dependent epimerase/dehydratase family protein [Profundibacterium mesophilum]|uniref:UDP-glucose 4-epimerase n=1 Tax=Profundibacterium mesophilum KAUST100406-0324 TaxID=1037889 RepID=A0A921NWF9_9RHOB|nr:NAD(P)-dependent oxidoreductase [Profundibacterium mesophilum]KAF0676601.1 UDP-glucose 4-epimerase [Profundibacterium mesophilum KAUST100406-0324]